MSDKAFKAFCDIIYRLVNRIDKLEREIISLNTKIEKLTWEVKK